MKVKIGNKIYDGDEEPVMVILSKDEKKQISQMSNDNNKYCSYPGTNYWMDNDYKKIKEWME